MPCKSFFVIFLIFLFPLISFSQKFTISGYVSDAASGEKIPGAVVVIGKTGKGTGTNTYGFYSLTLPSDSIELAYSFVGYNPVIKKIYLKESITLNIKLIRGKELKEVEISSNKNKLEENTRMGTIEVPISQIKKVPALMGEVDVLKSLQLLPGVQSGGEGSSGMYVRGGGPDQNLILLDGVPVYNVSHLFGFFSIFNADAIKSVELTKGGFPARYGGRLSSVVDISMKEGNMNKLSGEGTLGLVASKLTLEGPIFKDKTSFIISGRRTYIDLLARPLIKSQSNGQADLGYYFYDVNAKINHIFSQRDRLYFSIYTGKDVFFAEVNSTYNDGSQSQKSTSEFGLNWGNITSALRWNHILNPRLFGNITLTYSKYQFTTLVSETESGQSNSSVNLKYFSGITDWSGKVDFDFLPSPSHYIKFGGNLVSHTFNPGAFQFKSEGSGFNLDTTLGNNRTYTTEYGIYLEDDFRVNNDLKINLGSHYAGLYVKGKYFNSLQPRISARYFITSDIALKASYATMQQNIHLLSNSTVGLPTDLWVPATVRAKPEFSQQIAVGASKTFLDDRYEMSIESYYKTMNNLIEYTEGANFLNPTQDWQDNIEIGKGRSYGVELFIQKKEGKTSGWIGYTLAWSKRTFQNLNKGIEFPYKYDRRHDLSIVVMHEFNERIDIAGTFVFGTGNALTLPIGRFLALPPSSDILYFSGTSNLQEIELLGDRNSFRMASYHRLDLGINFRKKKKNYERTWNISFYNTYNHKNPYFLYFTRNSTGDKTLKQVSLFPIIPSVSYSIKF